MDEETTQNINESRSFEERVFARFDALESTLKGMDARLQTVEVHVQNMDTRLQTLEAKSYDTKPIWEQALKEIVETRRELSKRLDSIDAIAHETRADLRDAEDRIERLESKST